MNKLIAMMCFMVAALPLAFAQDKAKDDTRKAAPAAEVKAGTGKDADKKSEKSKGDEKKVEKAKRERTDAQKANDDKNKARKERQRTCDKMAKDKKLTSEDRKAFMGDCLSPKK